MNPEGYLQQARDTASREGVDPWTAFMRVLTRRLLARPMPSELEWASAQAIERWERGSGHLEAAKEQVWRYIDAFQPRGSDPKNDDGRTARALLCVLEPSGDEDLRHDIAEWFSMMVDETR